MAKISLLFVLALLSFKDTSKHAVLRTEIETNVTTSGCLFYNSGFGGGFFFYPNTSIANLNEILSNEYNYIGFRLFFVCNDFLLLDHYDSYFSTIFETSSTGSTPDGWKRIHFAEVEMNFDIKNVRLKSEAYPVGNFPFVLNGEVVELKVVGTIYEAKINPTKVLEKNGNVYFRQDTERFYPEHLKFDCKDDGQQGVKSLDNNE